ncbi:MAG: tRNA (adenosine(37)-N6)-threonylcarbamoyltransferase complex ATPase subunit type 1 TsaE [Ectothiorhodospiraceae bacterium]|jgi:tRNA threonylcarbamoyladenosine biosynthesis protein TsaE
MSRRCSLPSAEHTEALGARIAAALPPAMVVHLCGDLGAGKTTLVRGLLRALGHSGAVKSPTYTLVEPYELEGRRLFHLDLYRLADAEELEFIGLRDLLDGAAVLLIEWPERGAGVLPGPDLVVRLERDGKGRRVALEAPTARGEAVLERLPQT